MELKQETKNKLTVLAVFIMLGVFAISTFAEITQPTSEYIAKSFLK